MTSETDWEMWFGEYRRFILHYAELADSMQAAMLCIGTELEGTTHRETDWRRLIAEIRAVYPGPLVYAANWSGEFERITFWDALDAIGIQAYFPVAGDSAVTPASLDEAWRGPLGRIEAISRRTGKPVILTEAGYRSSADAGIEPWRWRSPAAVDSTLQAQLVEALFRAFWSQPWFMGVYVWKWYPGIDASAGDDRAARRARDFTPQGKPAAEVMSRWFRRN
jgi:hypothetical protein